jgi:hypothetical protein
VDYRAFACLCIPDLLIDLVARLGHKILDYFRRRPRRDCGGRSSKERLAASQFLCCPALKRRARPLQKNRFTRLRSRECRTNACSQAGLAERVAQLRVQDLTDDEIAKFREIHQDSGPRSRRP